MSIADEIAKQYSANIIAARSDARRKLIANAADDKKRIESVRPRQQKNSKSIIEEAHPDEVFIAESDGLGGMVGNLEQVHDQIMNALNRRPSAFPYQGLVASAMLDFKKTAEILESYDLHVEADAVLKLAGDLLAVLERQGKIRKNAIKKVDPGIFGDDPFDTGAEDIKHGPAEPSKPPEASATKGVIRPPDAPAAPSQSASQPTPAPSTTSQPGTQPGNGPGPEVKAPTAGPATEQATADASKAAAEVESRAAAGAAGAAAERKWLSALKGFSEGALKFAGKAIPVALLGLSLKEAVEDLGKGDVSSLLTLAGGAAVGIAGAVFLPELVGGSILSAAIGGALGADVLGQVVKFGWSFLKRDNFPEKLEKLRSYVALKAAAASGGQKSALDEILAHVDGAIISASDLERETSKNTDITLSAAAVASLDLGKHIADARDIYTKSNLNDQELDLLLKEVEESLVGFNNEIGSRFGEKRAAVDNALANLKNQPELAKEALDRLHAAQSQGKEFVPDQNLAQSISKPDQVVETAVSDPEEIKQIQGSLGTSKTGEWDIPTMNALKQIRENWLGFDSKLKDVVTVPALQAAGPRVLKQITELWNNRYTEAMP